MNYRTFFLATMLALSASPLAQAKNAYIAQAAVGNASGLDAADANALAWLNTSANWGSGTNQINPGDTLHLVGTFTSPLIVQGSGTAGRPITFLFESNANFTAGCWPGTGAIQLNGQSWITIDGGVNGLIQNTNNGTRLATQNNSAGINGGVYFAVIKNLTVTNIYKNIAGDATRAGYGLNIAGSSITVSNCNLSDGDGPLSYDGPHAGNGTWSNIFFLNNRILNFNHGIEIGIGGQSAPPQNCTITNLVIAGNYIDHSDVFDEPSGSHHLDDIIILDATYDPTVVITGFYIYNNTFGGHFGIHNTAAIFTDIANPLFQIKNYFIYNNLFLSFSNTWGNGMFIGGGSNVWVVNNTIYGTNGSGSFVGGGIAVSGNPAFNYNNIVMGGSGITLGSATGDTNVSGSTAATNDIYIVNKYLTNVWSDFNIFAGADQPGFGLALVATTIGNTLWIIGGGFHTLADWQTWYQNEWGNGSLPPPLIPGLYAYARLHCDPHSTTQMPVFNPGTYVPAANDTVAKGKGTNLWAAFAAAGIPWVDFNGNPRPTNGPVDIGAFSSLGPSGPFVSLVASPSAITNGQSVQLNWTSVNATNVLISGLGQVSLTGSTNVQPNYSVTSVIYTATAIGAHGTNTANVRVSMPPFGLHN